MNIQSQHINPLRRTVNRLTFAFAALFAAAATAADIPDDFPRFVVPGRAAEMDSLRQLFWVHWATAGPQIPLWDEWLPNATLWPAIGSGNNLNQMRMRWAMLSPAAKSTPTVT